MGSFKDDKAEAMETSCQAIDGEKNSFLDMLTELQGDRMDDQRCQVVTQGTHKIVLYSRKRHVFLLGMLALTSVGRLNKKQHSKNYSLSGLYLTFEEAHRSRNTTACFFTL